MKTFKSQPSMKSPSRVLFLLLFILMAGMFWRSFLPDYVLFSNDGSLAIQKSDWIHLPEAFIGSWYDLNSLGVSGGVVIPDFTQLFRWIFGAIGYAKFIAPVSLWFLGAAAFFFFRRAGMTAMASILGALAAAFTTGFFSNVCWGSIPPAIAFGMDMLALGALIKRDKLPFWVAPALAGFAVGANVIEAADIGALFSLLLAVFSIYQSIAEGKGSFVSRIARGVGRMAIMAVFASFIAAYAVSILIGVNIKGISGTKQDDLTKADHYDVATQWSVPKKETLSLVVPNLFGCNVITPGSANYWGGIGTDPAWDRYFASNKQGPPPSPNHFLRHTGRGIYIGAMIVLIAFWAGMQSLRKNDPVFALTERRFVWFWWAVSIVSLLLAWGRFAPFYQIVYHLPYFSTIRNPEKFLHFVTFSMVVLFAYGIHGLNRRYMAVSQSPTPDGWFKTWWKRAPTCDRRWVVASAGILLLSLVAWGIYAAMRGNVESYLVELQRLDLLRNGKEMNATALGNAQDFAASQVSFSLHQVGWFILVIAVSSVLLVLILTGKFAGRRARWAGVFLGIVLVGDLVRANQPYIVFWNYKEKYEVGNPEPVIKFLGTKAYEHRVAYLLPQPLSTPEAFSWFQQLYTYEWTQQLFPFYNIPTLDIVQMPRIPEDLNAFNTATQVGLVEGENGRLVFDEKTMYRIGRLWQLSATRYLVGPAPLLDFINQRFDTVPNRFRIIQKFNLAARPETDRVGQISISQLEAAPTDTADAPYALFEYTGALPRASLFSNWEVVTNDQVALAQLISPSFDPTKLIVLSKSLPANAKPTGANSDMTMVKFTKYLPADIKLEATPNSPAVLMLCDKYDPAWQVFVDGKRSEVLRCNFLMRGVFLEPGHHQIEFRFRPNDKMFYANLVAIFAAVCMLGYAMVTVRRPPASGELAFDRGAK